MGEERAKDSEILHGTKCEFNLELETRYEGT